jgi:glyoxylase-like metal-dependent hydrolase (beta-lactamase superfamily II)
MLSIQTFTFNAFAENTYVAYDETKECVIVDPGCYSRDEQNELVGFIESEKLIVKYLLNTHCHVDHVLGNYFTKEKFRVPFLIHEQDLPTLKSVKLYAPMYGFAGYHEADPDNFLKEGDTLTFGNTALKILFLPGHAPGHIGFYEEESKVILAGDVLFDGSIGRTDLPGGNLNTLLNSIRQKLFSLPDETIVYPGHGPATTVGKEKISNPYCALSLS